MYEQADLKTECENDSVYAKAFSDLRYRRRAVEYEIQKYCSALHAIETNKRLIREEEDKMSTPKSIVWSDMPKGPPNPGATAERWAASIDKIRTLESCVLKEQSIKARFESAWGILDQNCQMVLEKYYGIHMVAIKNLDVLGKKLGYSKRQMIRIKQQGLERLADELLGIC